MVSEFVLAFVAGILTGIGLSGLVWVFYHLGKTPKGDVQCRLCKGRGYHFNSATGRHDVPCSLCETTGRTDTSV